ncbi:hypothetical protein IGI04_019959, partial [Brassica rapa subsp. trilocularis]
SKKPIRSSAANTKKERSQKGSLSTSQVSGRQEPQASIECFHGVSWRDRGYHIGGVFRYFIVDVVDHGSTQMSRCGRELGEKLFSHEQGLDQWERSKDLGLGANDTIASNLPTMHMFIESRIPRLMEERHMKNLPSKTEESYEIRVSLEFSKGARICYCVTRTSGYSQDKMVIETESIVEHKEFHTGFAWDCLKIQLGISQYGILSQREGCCKRVEGNRLMQFYAGMDLQERGVTCLRQSLAEQHVRGETNGSTWYHVCRGNDLFEQRLFASKAFLVSCAKRRVLLATSAVPSDVQGKVGEIMMRDLQRMQRYLQEREDPQYLKGRQTHIKSKLCLRRKNQRSSISQGMKVFQRSQRMQVIFAKDDQQILQCTARETRHVLEFDMGEAGWEYLRNITCVDDERYGRVNHWFSVLEDVLIGSVEGMSRPGVSRSVNKYKAHHKEICRVKLVLHKQTHLKLSFPQESPLANGQILIDGQVLIRLMAGSMTNKHVQVVYGDAHVSAAREENQGVSWIRWYEEQVDQIVEQRDLLVIVAVQSDAQVVNQDFVESLSSSDGWMAGLVQSNNGCCTVFKDFDSRLNAHEWNQKAKEKINLQKDVQLGSQLKTIDEGFKKIMKGLQACVKVELKEVRRDKRRQGEAEDELVCSNIKRCRHKGRVMDLDQTGGVLSNADNAKKERPRQRSLIPSQVARGEGRSLKHPRECFHGVSWRDKNIESNDLVNHIGGVFRYFIVEVVDHGSTPDVTVRP